MTSLAMALSGSLLQTGSVLVAVEPRLALHLEFFPTPASTLVLQSAGVAVAGIRRVALFCVRYMHGHGHNPTPQTRLNTQGGPKPQKA